MKSANADLIALLESTNQVVMWDRYTFSMANGPVVRYPPAPPLPQALAFHDTFNGSGSLAAHTPDVAPAGFAWTQVSTPNGMELAGGVVRSDNISLNSKYDSAGSSPAVNMPLSFPFYMEIQAHRNTVNVGDNDEASFTVATANEAVKIAVAIRSNGSQPYFAYVQAGSLSIGYPLTGNFVHTCRALFDGSTCIVFADGVEKPAQSCALEAFNIGKVSIVADSQLSPFAARYEISEITLATP